MPRKPSLTLSGEWRELEDDERVVFSLPTVHVRGRPVVFDDGALRDAVRSATGGAVDQPVRVLDAPRVRPAAARGRRRHLRVPDTPGRRRA
jgi:hypothetical protein